jgi:type VI protein secretion system component VasK
MPRPGRAPGHDPFWDLDGTGARRSRVRQRIVQLLLALLAVGVLAVIVTHVPAVDAASLTQGSGRPALIGTLLAVVAACALIAVTRFRPTSQG